jgi:UDPglucose--hexose-1-phosphate uridylyltransferase
VPDLRRDELTGRCVIVAPARSARPHQFPPPVATKDAPAGCPFCHGNETLTPPEVHRTGAGDAETPGWRVRVVPNLYPITPGHEVVVLSPDHGRSFAQLDAGGASEVLAVMRDRVRFHLERGARYVQALVNHGREAGASLEHPHGQLVPLDLVPPAVAHQLDRFQRAGADPVETEAEAAGTAALDVSTGPVALWCPHAGVTPFELRVAHRGRATRFDEASDDEIAAVATATRDGLRRLAAVLGDVPYNLVVHSAPPDTAFHWWIEVQTRVALVAGFEIGTGIFVNVTPPDLAARQLREAAGA